MTDSEFGKILAAIRDQWVSMAGMGMMFTTSILIGVFIQPFYNFEEMRAFGEEGTTEAGNILLELVMIFLFTAAIIWFARRGLKVLIKGIIFFALGYSLLMVVLPIFSILIWLLEVEVGGSVAFMACLGITVGMMYTLHRFPEWYVVNTVGVLVGSGVVVMLGIAFVPVLIIFFMILAAIYDHWAVNKSKHMLELADTMIGLKLPVLLVAPKNSSYTFLEQEADVMRKDASEESVRSSEPSDRSKSGGRDALFMGLGDVIFPGMLVISSITFLPDAGPVVFDFWGDPTKPISLGPMLVGMGTLVGGLLGYMALMTQVARGKPQAGLPLLNGGSILGYLISGAIALGVDQLWQDISFL
ncbi:MAG: presenilin family intramembrane aspartyl protease PSH [Candidatus Thalassarchaeaceae archaeon]|nr:presenilin family intramembrane aspartyl protease PSH [Candidatus Thalassarchaeaceae archaeon]